MCGILETALRESQKTREALGGLMQFLSANDVCTTPPELIQNLERHIRVIKYEVEYNEAVLRKHDL